MDGSVEILGIQRDVRHNLCSLEAYSTIEKTGTEGEKKIVCLGYSKKPQVKPCS